MELEKFFERIEENLLLIFTLEDNKQIRELYLKNFVLLDKAISILEKSNTDFDTINKYKQIKSKYLEIEIDLKFKLEKIQLGNVDIEIMKDFLNNQQKLRMFARKNQENSKESHYITVLNQV